MYVKTLLVANKMFKAVIIDLDKKEKSERFKNR